MTTLMTSEDALLATVQADPFDPITRYALADLREEQNRASWLVSFHRQCGDVLSLPCNAGLAQVFTREIAKIPKHGDGSPRISTVQVYGLLVKLFVQMNDPAWPAGLRAVWVNDDGPFGGVGKCLAFATMSRQGEIVFRVNIRTEPTNYAANVPASHYAILCGQWAYQENPWKYEFFKTNPARVSMAEQQLYAWIEEHKERK